MNKFSKILICIFILLALTACGKQQEEIPMANSVSQNLNPVTPTPVPTANIEPEMFYEENYSEEGNDSIFYNNSYDIAEGAVEDVAQLALAEEQSSMPVVEANGSYGSDYIYAGSTPVPLYPVDLPPITPVPVNIVYAPYQINLGLSFEAPAGWEMNDSTMNVVTLGEPIQQMKDGQIAQITISAVPVNEQMSIRELKDTVEERLDVIGGSNFVEWKQSYTAERYLLGSKGVYANYWGTLSGEVKIGGRIHYVCVDQKLYGLEIVYPIQYSDVFLDVFAKARETLTFQ